MNCAVYLLLQVSRLDRVHIFGATIYALTISMGQERVLHAAQYPYGVIFVWG
jgi:hypothetical protein